MRYSINILIANAVVYIMVSFIRMEWITYSDLISGSETDRGAGVMLVIMATAIGIGVTIARNK